MIYILTGPVHSGKTTFLKKIVAELKKEKINVAGFLSEAVFDGGKLSGYDLFDLKKEKSVPFIRRKGKKSWQRSGPFFFLPQGLAEAKRIILRAKTENLLIVDEAGPLELAEKGLWPALERVLSQPLTSLFLVVRENIVGDFLKKLGEKEVRIFNIQEKKTFSELKEEIKSCL